MTDNSNNLTHYCMTDVKVDTSFGPISFGTLCSALITLIKLTSTPFNQ